VSVNRFHPFARSPYLPTLTRFCLLAPVTDCVALDTASQHRRPDASAPGRSGSGAGYASKRSRRASSKGNQGHSKVRGQ
jgi:hypothetical protein